MANEHRKKYSITLVTGEMKIKTTGDINILTRMVTTEKTDNSKFGKDVKQLELLHIAKNVKCEKHFKVPENYIGYFL